MDEVDDQENMLLREIGTVVASMRELRSTNAVAHRRQLSTLSAELGVRWEAVRRFRAPRVVNELPARRAHYD